VNKRPNTLNGGDAENAEMAQRIQLGTLRMTIGRNIGLSAVVLLNETDPTRESSPEGLRRENDMSKRAGSFFVRLIAAAIFVLFVAQISAGQTNQQAEDKETLQALLTEVRMLRLALQTLQRMSIDTYRSQLLVDRIRVNREDVRRLTASLNETRDLFGKTQTTIPQFIDRQKLLESQVQLEVDPGKRAQLEFEVKRTKEGIEMYKSQLDQLRQREEQLTAQLNSEKSKLDELENRLDLLERGIENDRQRFENDKTGPERKP
jgi:hypothetical protein